MFQFRAVRKMPSRLACFNKSHIISHFCSELPNETSEFYAHETVTDTHKFAISMRTQTAPTDLACHTPYINDDADKNPRIINSNQPPPTQTKISLKF